MKTYLYDDTEVILTGRTAKKQRKKYTWGRPVSGVTESEYIDILVEIEPIGSSISWKKWVKQKELYEITKGDTDDGIIS